MDMVIDAKQLRKALADIEKAEANGFKYCLAVVRLVSAGRMLGDNKLEYSDMIEKAHPVDARYNWGRFQGVSRRNKFINGKLVPNGN
jgi:hypothetical protein